MSRPTLGSNRPGWRFRIYLMSVRRRDKVCCRWVDHSVSMSYTLAHGGDQLDYGTGSLMRTSVGELGFGTDHLATVRGGPVAADQ